MSNPKVAYSRFKIPDSFAVHWCIIPLSILVVIVFITRLLLIVNMMSLDHIIDITSMNYFVFRIEIFLDLMSRCLVFSRASS